MVRDRPDSPVWLPLVCLLLLPVCGGREEDGRAAVPGGGRYPLDPSLRLNHVQAKGTHNSYHLEPPLVFVPSHRYSHVALEEQLDGQGVRQFELDLHLRAGAGFEVFHLPLVDQETSCRRLVECLAGVKAWSDAHPGHMPILIWFEPKDDADWLIPGLQPILGHYEELEDEILSVWPRERILTPDDLRGGYATLPEAIRAEGWPSLGELRGRVGFALLDDGAHRDAYTRYAHALEGRLLFVAASEETAPFAAMFKVNNARADADRVRRLVEAGFLVTSNVDSVEADDADNFDRLDASLAAGAHFLSTDYPAPVRDRSYWFEMADGNPARCNPVSGPDGCSSPGVENLY